MFLGMYYPDKKSSALDNLRDAALVYEGKFKHKPPVCLTSAADATELLASGGTDVVPTIKGVNFIPRRTFYLGHEEPVDGPEKG